MRLAHADGNGNRQVAGGEGGKPCGQEADLWQRGGGIVVEAPELRVQEEPLEKRRILLLLVVAARGPIPPPPPPPPKDAWHSVASAPAATAFAPCLPRTRQASRHAMRRQAGRQASTSTSSTRSPCNFSGGRRRHECRIGAQVHALGPRARRRAVVISC